MLKKFQTNFLILLSVLIFVGCVSNGVVIEEQSRALNELVQIASTSLPAGRRKISQNGHEVYSNYFIRSKQGEFIEGADSSTRYYCLITVLGDRRPYNIEVVVVKEKRRRNGQYDQVGYDKSMARVISRRLEQALHQRREDSNTIDDFKVF